MSKPIGLVVGTGVLMAALAGAAPSDEVTFKTTSRAPSGFDSWTFFWQMPEINHDAELTYVVVQPDGKEYMSYDKPIKGTPGRGIRSDFSKGMAKADPSVFYGQDIVIKLRVDKGKLKFDPQATFDFEFRTTVKAQAVRGQTDGGAGVDADHMRHRQAQGGAPSPQRIPSAAAPSGVPVSEIFGGLHYGLCIHFDLETFSGKQRGDAGFGTVPAIQFSPTQMNVRQWAQVAKQAGMDSAILHVKSLSGFCLWPSEYYDYNIAKSPMTNDIVREFVAACKAEGIFAGVAYNSNNAHVEGRVKGPREPIDSSHFALIRKQIEDLADNYPELLIFVLWDSNRFSPEEFQQLKHIIMRSNPQRTIFQNAWYFGGAKWPGPKIAGLPGHAYDSVIDRNCWTPNVRLKTVSNLLGTYTQSHQLNLPYTLNIGPDRRGLIPDDQIAVLMELKGLLGSR